MMKNLTNKNFKASNLNEEDYNTLCRMNYTRKAGHPDEVCTYINACRIDDKLFCLIASIDLVEIENTEYCFYDDIFDGDVQFYVVKVDNKYYLVDTQGYKYARYAVLIENYDHGGNYGDYEA